jgi:hypothetical protein
MRRINVGVIGTGWIGEIRAKEAGELMALARHQPVNLSLES